MGEGKAATPLESAEGATIDILLATYNGAAYLDEQLASIEAQTYSNWHLLARDDGSTDRTPEILASFQARHPEKVTIIRDGDGNIGLVQNFSRLMEISTAPYAAFCDQDDVWLPAKLSLCLEKMRELEATYGTEKPLLVFTDLTVVDEDLKILHPSFWRYQRIDVGSGRSFQRLLVMNVVTGCTSLMNRLLVNLAVPIPAGARVHDWWVALIVAGTGVLSPLPHRTVCYRQHAAQNIGAKAASVLYLPRYAVEVARKWRCHRANTAVLYSQAKALQDRFVEALPDELWRTLNLFLSIPDANLTRRLTRAVQAKCLPSSLLRSLKFLIMS